MLSKFKCDPKLDLRKGRSKTFNKLLANLKGMLSSKLMRRKYNIFGQQEAFRKRA